MFQHLNPPCCVPVCPALVVTTTVLAGVFEFLVCLQQFTFCSLSWTCADGHLWTTSQEPFIMHVPQESSQQYLAKSENHAGSVGVSKG